jgi:hypothetical protein
MALGYGPSSICRVLEAGVEGDAQWCPISIILKWHGRPRRIAVLRGVYMPDSIEERLARIEAYLHKRYLYLKEKPRTSFEEMELLKEFGFDEPPKA